MLFGWGIALYAVMSLVSMGSAIYGFTSGLAPHVVELLILLCISILAGRALKFQTWKDILPYSIGWAIIAVVLDAIFAVPLSGWGLYSLWSVWAGYALIALLPLLAPFTRAHADPHGAWET
jgi:hypothetical protein